MSDLSKINALASEYFQNRKSESLQKLIFEIKDMKRNLAKFDFFQYKFEELKPFLLNVNISDLNVIQDLIVNKIALLKESKYEEIESHIMLLKNHLLSITKKTNYKFSDENYFVEFEGVIYHQMKYVLR